MKRQTAETQGQFEEADLIRRALLKDDAAIRVIIQNNNRRLYRIARSIVHDDSEAEDVLQEAYLRAFTALGSFRGESRLATWLSRIVLNEAYQRMRRRTEMPAGRVQDAQHRMAEIIPFPLSGPQAADPERAMAQREICNLLERAIDALPEEFRTVLMARTIENLSIEDTASLLGLKPETVKTRLHRARTILRAELADHLEPMLADIFPFDGARCARLTNAVVSRVLAG